jgi:predicted MPP superfamily phosphohydrolase
VPNSSSVTREAKLRKRQRMQSFLIFFSIVLTVYGLINFYVYIRGLSAIPMDSGFRAWYLPLFLFFAVSYFAGQILETYWPTTLSDVLSWIGAIWLFMLTYLLLACILIDLARLLDYFFSIFPRSWSQDPEPTRRIVASVTVAVVAICGILGFLNARYIRVKPLEIVVHKHNPTASTLRIAAISDMHMGTLVARGMVSQMVEKINSIHPDIVLMAGDEVDGNPHPAIDMDLGGLLKQIKSTYGVFGITGNHEYIGTAETSCAYLNAHNVRMLRDSVAEVAGLYIIGREDRSMKQFAHRDRKDLSVLLEGLDREKSLILMDHQPFHLEEAEQAGIDFQLSGHTHHAQIWPFNYITDAVYEVSWGFKKKGSTNIYVSCGAGTWGPPMRIGNTPEIMDITIHFEGPKK